MSESTGDAPPPPAKDPLKSFRGVMAGALILQAIFLALALPVVENLGHGIGSAQGWAVGGVVGALIVCCGLLRWRVTIGVVLALQIVLIGFFLTLPAVGVIGLVFLGVWAYMLWLRHDVTTRMAEGRLPSQQPEG